MNFERAALIVFGLAALLYVYRLDDPPASYAQPGDPPVYVHDECYQAFTAERWAYGDTRAWDPYAKREDMARFNSADMTKWTVYEWIHPPTAKLIMAGLIKVFGFRPAAYRLGSVLFGLFTLGVTWLFARRLGGPLFALFALILISADGMMFVMSRIAMNDIYVTGCAIAAMYFVHRWWTEDRLRWLLIAGVVFGVGVTMKWNIASLMFGAALVTLGRIIFIAAQPIPEDEKKKRVMQAPRSRMPWRALGTWALAFVVSPVVLYLLSYAPYFMIGYTWDNWTRLHQEIFTYHKMLKAVHSQGSRWWEWPLVTRPVWFFLHRTPGEARVIYAMGNPLLWWAFIPSLIWVAIRFLLKRDPGDGAILMGFCAFWLPWIFVDRVAFQQYLLPSVPFGVLAVVRSFDDLAKKLGERGRFVLPTYAAIVVCVFINFYPFWSARPISDEELKGSRYYWFETWRKN